MTTTNTSLHTVSADRWDGLGLRVEPYFTTPGVHPYDELEWEFRDAVIKDWKTGKTAFEQRDVEFPKSWSHNATTIVAQKYFRGHLGTPDREHSVRQMIDRVADTITAWGRKDGYFADAESTNAFNLGLKHLLVNQKAAFNSPVWFNVGVSGREPQCSACFILSVEDTMGSILNWYVEEGIIFKGGSGSGVNLSRIRSSVESLAGGGTASGPVSFMRGADASAGTIKSGGTTRRAAKMVILNVDHPDIEEFIWCKQREERKARALREAGFDMDLDGRDFASIQYQNANNSVRVTDEFMQAVLADEEFTLRTVTTDEPVKTVRARDLMHQIAQAAWECADPGMQYDTTINDWHTTPNAGRINGSNPCFAGDALVHTDKGLVRFDDLFRWVQNGEAFAVYTHDATSVDTPTDRVALSSPDAFMITGRNPIIRLEFSNGTEIRCTPGHPIFTVNRGFVPAEDLRPDDRIKALNLPTPAVSADLALPVSTDPLAYQAKGDHQQPLCLPEKWSPEFAEYLGWLVGDGSICGNGVSTIYRRVEEQEHLLPRHQVLVAWMNGDHAPKPSVQANGTIQLHQSHLVIRRFIEALGVCRAKASDKVVPWSVMQAPSEIAAAFLRGLLDADGCVHDGKKDRYVGLGSGSSELVHGVQILLSALGIRSCIFSGGHRVGYDLRIASQALKQFERIVGFSLPSKVEQLARALDDHVHHGTDETVHLAKRTDDGFELTYNLSEPRNHSYIVNGIIVRNCSEYMHLDNSACNLASLNLRKFEIDSVFDVEAFRHAVEIVFIAQEIIVGNSSYPTAKIAANATAYRQLGLGYANLGGLLMSLGLAYDSDEGRAWAAAITALMTGHAYRTSAEIARVAGPFEGYARDREGMLRVLRKHRAAVEGIDVRLAPANVLSAARQAWDDAVALSAEHGVRNAQASVLAPTGTIGLMMDCDTTGIEPDLGLVKSKKLVGGGTMRIVNHTVPVALRRLGYQNEQIEAILEHIDEHATIEGAPAFKPEHLPVFDCAMGERSIPAMGHVTMMAVVQPFISGALSKCLVGETLLPTGDGLIRIESLHRGEKPDAFRDEILEVASLGGPVKTDAFYYGGKRRVRKAVLRSGHTVTGTENHCVLVASGSSGLVWRSLDELQPGEYVATQYGSNLWSTLPARFDDFRPGPRHPSHEAVEIPTEMTVELAFLLGAYAAGGRTVGDNQIVITNLQPAALQRVARAWDEAFGIESGDGSNPSCPQALIRSQAVREFFEYLGCGHHASRMRIPDPILRSPREMVLAFLQGLTLKADVTATGQIPTWVISLDSSRLVEDLQAVLTNLGVVHNQASGRVEVAGIQARRLTQLVPFIEPEKATRAQDLLLTASAGHADDVVPGIPPRELHGLIPPGNGHRRMFTFLCHPDTLHVSWETLDRVSQIPGVELPEWLQRVLVDNLRFSPVESMTDDGERDVFDISVPTTHAFVGNGVVNHNTVNLPESATVEDLERLYVEGWRRGLKALAIYRDNCKVAQPLSLAAKKETANTTEQAAAQAGMVRRRLPKQRPSQTISFQVGDAEGYLTAGEYPGDGLGEIFVKLGKQGSTLSGVMDALAISVSIGLQYGVPLEVYVRKFTNMRFEPAGMTDDPEVRFATSIVDYLFRRLAIEYLPTDRRQVLGIYTMGERAALEAGAPAPGPWSAPVADTTGQAILPAPVDDTHGDAPMCYQCGVAMIRAGSCHCCPQCGTTSGCS